MTVQTDDKSADTLWQRLGLVEYISIDLETTGLDPDSNEIIEIGAVRFHDGIEVESFRQFVKPKVRKLPPEITKLTGIKKSDLKDQPNIKDVAQDFITFVGDSPVVGQNIGFDISFLQATASLASHFKPSHVIPKSHDTRLCARFLTPCQNAYGLAALCDRYKIKNERHHRAVEDARATGEIFAILAAQLAAVEQHQVADAFRLVEGTNSPLKNTLRCVINAQSSGYIAPHPPPNALQGEISDRTNIFTVEGNPRPEKDITEKQIVRLFYEKQRFNDLMTYEVRKEQVGMAVNVTKALQNGNFLLVEAGTGVGKSMGYLIPALLSKGRVIVSTYTKNLQDQLFFDEIPRLGRVFKFGFRAVLLKGRRNYLCRTRWRNYIMAPDRYSNSFKIREQAALIVRWVAETKTGDIGEINALSDGAGSLFRYIASEPGFCTTKVCGGKCPLTVVRREAAKADVVVVNHSLVLSDLMNESNLLGENVETIIFDEAHHIEDVATDQFGSEFNSPVLRIALDRITRIASRKGELWTVLAANRNLNRLTEPLDKISERTDKIKQISEQLFIALSEYLRQQIEGEAIYSTPFRYHSGDALHTLIDANGQDLQASLASLSTSLKRILDRIELEDDPDFPETPLQEIRSAVDEATGLKDALALSLSAESDNRVYWANVPPDLNQPISLNTAPLDVSETLAENVWERLRTAILTSATITTGSGANGFAHIVKHLGLDRLSENRLVTTSYGSPFNYIKNCLVCYPKNIPHPSQAYREHTDMVTEICSELALTLQKGMLVLFTSYRSMRSVEWNLSRLLVGSGVELFAQSGRYNREQLIRRFRQAKGNAILMGTDSFWEGVDVPGEALQIVVIPKLPFAVPSDPIVSARIDKMRADGHNPFFEYQIPEAALKVRQGAGRLIRTGTDHGVILVLDPRVTTKGYGRVFRELLAGKVTYPENTERIVQDVAKFFAGFKEDNHRPE